MDAGLLLVRVTFGTLMAAHGSQKLFGWFGGHGLAGTAGYFEAIGFQPGRPFATAASLAETVAGVMLAAGLLGPIPAAILVSVMIVAAVSVHWQNGLFAASNGIEVPLLYGAAAAALALTGPGAYSLDAVLGLAPLWTPVVTWTVVALGIAGALGSLALRRTTPQAVAA